MIALSDRERLLVKILQEVTAPLTVGQLADRLHVSARTIRYDLDDVRAWAREQGGDLETRPRKGVRLFVPRGAGTLNTGVPSYAYPVNAEQRLLLVLSALLLGVPGDAHGLASSLSVSPSSARTDLKRASSWLRLHGLDLTRTGDDYSVTGDEGKRRRCLTRVLSQLSTDEVILNALGILLGSGDPEPDSPAAVTPRMSAPSVPCKPLSAESTASLHRLDAAVVDQLRRLFGSELVTQVVDVVTRTERDLSLTMTDEGFSFLVIHLVVAISRLMRGKSASISDQQYQEISGLPEYGLASRLANGLEEALGLTLPEAETCYIALHLFAAREFVDLSRLPDSVPGPADGGDRVQQLCRAIISLAENVLECSLANDRQLLAGLVIHVRPLLNRLKFGIRVSNPVLKEVMEQYPEVHKAALVASTVLSRETGRPVSADEAGFVAIHLAASLERLYGGLEGPRVLLVCGSGVGTVRLLTSRLAARFPRLHVARVGSVLSLADDLKTVQPDLVISTIPLEDVDRPVIVVSPLLDDQDAEQVEKHLALRQAGTRPRFLVPTQNPRDMLALSTDPSADQAGLSHWLDPRAIRVGVTVADWRQAVYAATRPLVELDAVDARYPDQIIEAIEKHGPYQVIAPGLALLHAASGPLVHRGCLGLTVLRLPVEFGAPDKDPVSVLLVLAAQDTEGHIRALQQVTALLVRDEVMPALRRASSPKEVLAALAAAGA